MLDINIYFTLTATICDVQNLNLKLQTEKQIYDLLTFNIYTQCPII